ncbi:MAG: polymer-forming cytoskeletal protein [Elusimicrobiales bacterium]|nr:polymer-forming cytoskeletal protein [Elusimicrobiales bacterium]
MKEQIFKKAIIFACIIMLPAAAMAGLKWRISSDEVQHTDIVIGQLETINGDIVTDKSVTIDGVLNGDCVSLGGPVKITGKIKGDMVSLGGTIQLSGAIDGDLVAIGAPLEATGDIKGELVLIGSRALLKSSATVYGDIASIGGHMEKDESVIIKGNFVSVDLNLLNRFIPSILKITDYRRKHSSQRNGLRGLGLIMLIGVMLSGALMFILPAIFFPKNVKEISSAIKGDFMKSAGLGVIILVTLFPALLLIVISVLGIPLIPFAILFFCAALVLGFSGFTVIVTERFFEGIKRTAPKTLVGQVATGYLLLIAIMLIGKAIPIIGGIFMLTVFMVSVFGAILGLGATVTTRMGTVAAQQPAIAPIQKEETPSKEN